jgi:AcrR family transcriptional regulator
VTTIKKKTLKKTKKEKATAKRKVILKVAADLITQRGYDNTGLKEICEKASCSKSAIYEYFNNKEGLLAALTEDIAVDLSQTLHSFHIQHLSVEETLLRYSKLALKLILDERHIAIVRATISAYWNHPELGPTYYQVGARTAQTALAQYFELHNKSGELEISDPDWAAHEFQGILFWERMMAQVVGAKRSPTEEEIEYQAHMTVDTFMRSYGKSTHG